MKRLTATVAAAATAALLAGAAAAQDSVKLGYAASLTGPNAPAPASLGSCISADAFDLSPSIDAAARTVDRILADTKGIGDRLAVRKGER